MKTAPENDREQKSHEGTIPSGRLTLQGELLVPTGAKGIVLFAHGSGSSRHSPRNQQVARTLRQAGLATLLFDLLTAEEEELDMRTRHLRFDIELLATTEGADDPLEHHKAIRRSGWKGRVITTYRPDAVVDPEHEDFADALRR